MKIAIPSYRRSELINKLTLKLLRDCKVDNTCIYIFVSSKDEYIAYSYLKDYGYNIVYEMDLKNLKDKHNFIQDYFEMGERVVVMEDDIKSLKRKDGNSIINYYDFHRMVEIGWQECDRLGTKLWGIYPIANGMFMSESITSNLICIAGYLFGIEITKDKFLRCNTENKHDYERSILHYIKYGSVCRIDYIAQYSNSFTNKGGLQEQHSNEERCKNEISGNQYLVKRFPHLIRLSNRINKVFNAQTELRMKTTDNKTKRDDLISMQKIIDKKINFTYE